MKHCGAHQPPVGNQDCDGASGEGQTPFHVLVDPHSEEICFPKIFASGCAGDVPLSKFDRPEGGGQAVEQQQALRQRLPNARQQLDRLQGLERANDARGHAQHTCFPAPSAAG